MVPFTSCAEYIDTCIMHEARAALAGEGYFKGTPMTVLRPHIRESSRMILARGCEVVRVYTWRFIRSEEQEAIHAASASR